MTRTVAKANYRQTRGRAGKARGKSHARASASYYETRPNEADEYQEREAFCADESGLDHDAVNEKIEELGGEYFYRVMFSPGEDVEGEDLEEWTREVMQDFEGDWVAYAHEDQTEHPHVHLMAWTDEKLDRNDFKAMREMGDQAYERLHEVEQELMQQAEPDFEDGHLETAPEVDQEWS